MAQHPLDRREFLGGLGVLAAAGSANAATGDMIYRTLGKTGEKVSAIGLGGHHIGSPEEESEGIRLVRTALDRGMNFLDNCWDYHDGKSEVWMGKALARRLPAEGVPDDQVRRPHEGIDSRSRSTSRSSGCRPIRST